MIGASLRCAGFACENSVGPHGVLCDDCWSLVPVRLRQATNRASKDVLEISPAILRLLRAWCVAAGAAGARKALADAGLEEPRPGPIMPLRRKAGAR